MAESKMNQTSWSELVEDAIKAVLDEAGSHSPDTLEWMVLNAEPTCLREMFEEVGDKPAGQRRAMGSIVIASTARDSLKIPVGILEQLEAVYQWYRRANFTA